MKRFLSGSVAVLLIGAASFGAGARQTQAASKAGAMMMGQYAGTLLAPTTTQKVAGAVGMVAGGAPIGAAAAPAGGVTVAIHVEGLTPGATYLARVSSGACGGSLTLKFPLPNLVANPMGEANAMASLQAPSVPAKGYAVTVHRSDAAKTVLACGDAHTPGMVSQIKQTGSKVNAVAMITAPVKVLGNKVTQGTEVLVFATGLVPLAAHPFHIHAGPCGVPAPVMYPLGDLVGNMQGMALIGTGLTDIIPMAGVSIHIHDTSFKMVACGNIGGATPSM